MSRCRFLAMRTAMSCISTNATAPRNGAIKSSSRKAPRQTSSRRRACHDRRRRRPSRKAAGYTNAGTVEFIVDPATEALLLPRTQRAPASRASRHRSGDGARSGGLAVQGRGGRSVAASPGANPPARPCRGSADMRRRSRERLSALAGQAGGAALAGVGAAHRKRRRGGRCHRAALRLDDRQTDRAWREPRRRDRRSAERPRRHVDRRAEDQRRLPARAAGLADVSVGRDDDAFHRRQSGGIRRRAARAGRRRRARRRERAAPARGEGQRGGLPRPVGRRRRFRDHGPAPRRL